MKKRLKFNHYTQLKLIKQFFFQFTFLLFKMPFAKLFNWIYYQNRPQPTKQRTVENTETKSYCQWLKEFHELTDHVESYHCLPMELIMENEWLRGHIINDQNFPSETIPDIPQNNPLGKNIYDEKYRQRYINDVCNKLDR